jgi:hypothetical protein
LGIGSNKAVCEGVNPERIKDRNQQVEEKPLQTFEENSLIVSKQDENQTKIVSSRACRRFTDEVRTLAKRT